jgi:zinc/manganese transport system substrate-binding protein/manganese/iron transport system substrate-binding protein
LLDLGAADVLVTSGVDLESWLDDAIAASGFAGTVIDASTGVTLLAAGAVEEETDHVEGEVEADGHDHDHGASDPHIWTNPANAILMVENIEAGFTEADPAQSSVFATNAAAYVEQLTAVNEWATASIDQVPLDERLLVTNHDAFTYFYNAYGITFVGSIIPSLDDNAEPSAAELDALIAAIQASGAKAVFSEASLSPKLAETIAQEAGVAVYSGDTALYSDSLGAPGSSGETYLAATIHNVTVLVDSWGYEALPLPATLTI